MVVARIGAVVVVVVVIVVVVVVVVVSSFVVLVSALLGSKVDGLDVPGPFFYKMKS